MGSVADPLPIGQVHGVPPALSSMAPMSMPSVPEDDSTSDTVNLATTASVKPSQQCLSLPDSEKSNIARRASKLGIFGLFNRSKIALDIDTPQENLETQWHGIVSTERPASRDQNAMYVPPERATTPVQKTPASSLRRQSSKSALLAKASFKRDPKTSATWSPPPLFQAYPQAVKYATLRAPSVSAETILRHSRDKSANSNGSDARAGSVGGDEKAEQKERKLKKAVADLASNSAWVDKTYVLVTSGYLLQYSGTGSFDRLPEKILPLTENSAAFASDVIPGRHFVLQVSQVSSEDGTVDLELSKSVFKKIGLKHEMKRATSSILLILDNPQEMDDWLVAVRKAIEELGGQEYKPDIVQGQAIVDPATKLHRMPSQRYLVKRDPHKFSEKTSEPQSDKPQPIESFGDTFRMQDDQDDLPESEQPEAPLDPKRESAITQQSAEPRYISDTQTSIDQIHLDRLRESYSSAGQGTTPTSRDSSPDRSSVKKTPELELLTTNVTVDVDFSFFEPSPRLEGDSFQPHAVDRESLQPTPTPQSRPVSTLPGSPSRATSPPNFSVPTFSKRFSGASVSSGPSSKPQSPAIGLHGSPTPQEREEPEDKRTSTVGELNPRPKSSLSASKRFSATQSGSQSGTPPASSHSHESSADAERSFSRRFSSLDYARGISPVKMAIHSPSPHPPPTGPLPPIPDDANVSKRSSLIPPPSAPPPTGPLPAVPSLAHSPQSSTASSPPLVTPQSGQTHSSTNSDVGLPLQKPSSGLPSAAQSPDLATFPALLFDTTPILEDQVSSPGTENFGPRSPVSPINKSTFDKPRGLRRPGSSQAQPIPSPVGDFTGQVQAAHVVEREVVSSTNIPSSNSMGPPAPTRQAPAPPSYPAPPIPQTPGRPPTPPKLHKHRSLPRLRRESQDVAVPRKLSKSKHSSALLNLSSPKQSGETPQISTNTPIIPPIDVSSRVSRSSFDGPWNAGYERSSRTFLDLSFG